MENQIPTVNFLLREEAEWMYCNNHDMDQGKNYSRLTVQFDYPGKTSYNYFHSGDHKFVFVPRKKSLYI